MRRRDSRRRCHRRALRLSRRAFDKSLGTNLFVTRGLTVRYRCASNVNGHIQAVSLSRLFSIEGIRTLAGTGLLADDRLCRFCRSPGAIPQGCFHHDVNHDKHDARSNSVEASFAVQSARPALVAAAPTDNLLHWFGSCCTGLRPTYEFSCWSSIASTYCPLRLFPGSPILSFRLTPFSIPHRC
jgi:hypothetical protein